MFDVQTICQQLPQGFVIVIFIIYSAWEYFMGKTKYGSTVEMIFEHPIQWFLSRKKGE